MALLTLTEKNFDSEVLKSDLPVLVDFWAEWCGPCKMVSPIVDEISTELEGKLKVGKVNVDEAQTLAQKYNVMSIPTLFVFKGGEVVEQIIGAMSKDQLLEKINGKI
ncbi:Thioredoxin [hydrothermal vent metagenome]|uniref:Thioredoxin n=1 Tax=hydrothermal vent metagenome TaxID=652676 RepID=A0A3B0TYI7_9ZZZZ